MEVAAALAAFQQVLQQVEHLRVPLGLDAPLLLQLLRPFPGLVVDDLRDRDLDPGVLWLVVDLHAVLGGDVTVLSVHPRARVGAIPQDVVHAGLKPRQLAGLCGDLLIDQPHGNGVGPSFPHGRTCGRCGGRPPPAPPRPPVCRRLRCGTRRGGGPWALAPAWPCPACPSWTAPGSFPALSCRWPPSGRRSSCRWRPRRLRAESGEPRRPP